MIQQSYGCHITKEQALNQVSFVKSNILIPFLKDIKNLWKSEEKVKTLTDKLHNELDLYEQVLLSASNGKSASSISTETGIPEKTLQSWISLGRLPHSFRSRSKESRRIREKDINIPRKESSEFAYFLGIFCAYTRPGTTQYHIRPTVTSEAISKRIALGFKVAVPSGASIKNLTKTNKVNYYEVNCLHLRLSRHCNFITAASTRVPWEHLGTRDEKIAFLQGFFDILGSFNMNEPGSFTVQKIHGENLLIEVSQIMSSLEIVPKIKLGSRPTLFINEKKSLKRMCKLNLLLEDDAKSKLKEIAYRSVSRRSYTAKQYYKAKNFWEDLPNLNNSEIAKLAKVPAEQIRSWRNRGKRPNEVERIEELEKLTPLSTQQQDMINHLFRSYKLTASIVRRIIMDFSLDEIDEQLNRIEVSRIDLSESPELIYKLLCNNTHFESKSIKPFQIEESDSIFDQNQETILKNFRKEIETQDTSKYPFIESILSLAKESINFSFPAFTYEKFIGELPEKMREQARIALLAFSPVETCTFYWHHLVEEGLVPKIFNNKQ